MKIKRALISVSDKTGILELARFLKDHQVELVSTGGTAALLAQEGIPTTPIESITGNPEAFGGRMKTISFQIGSALLFRRNQPEDQLQAAALGIEPLDLVICNLYPFESTVRSTDQLTTWVEMIDIGGPTMIRAAAKNFDAVTCITTPAQYPLLMQEMRDQMGGTQLPFRMQMALQAFQKIASYDLNIAFFLSQKQAFPNPTPLRYGENPHQSAVLLPFSNTLQPNTLAQVTPLQGKELSYNNYLDSDQAYKCTSELSHQFPDQAICTIVKHGNPCGVAVHPHLMNALRLAWNSDSVSAFGGILALNQEVTHEVADFLVERFIEVIIAPSFSEKARETFSKKKNIRVIELPLKTQEHPEWTIRSIHGGLLCQTEDEHTSDHWKSVTQAEFRDELRELSQFGLIVTKYLKSNCIGLYTESMGGLVSLASGTGQPNRLDCITKLIQIKLQSVEWNPQKTLLVSDAFFPFRDSIDAIHELGVKYVLQPGGSIRDSEVIDACNKYQIAMTFTQMRHFRH